MLNVCIELQGRNGTSEMVLSQVGWSTEFAQEGSLSTERQALSEVTEVS